MKRLTMNQVAKAGLKANKRAYLSLVITVFLAVYLAAAATLGCYCTWKARQDEMADRIGYINCFVTDKSEITDVQLRRSGLFSRIGHVYLSAVIEETGIYTGWYDEEAEYLLNRRCVEGRMPEKAGEIAIERSALESMRSGLRVGDTVTWKMHPQQGVPEERSYTLTGILNEQTRNLDTSYRYSYLEKEKAWPAALVSQEEPPYEVGSTRITRVMTYAPLVTYSRVDEYSWKRWNRANVYGVNRAYGQVEMHDSLEDEVQNAIAQMILWLIMGGCLLLATCIGISGAMEGVLSQRTEEIGMLRAVGATRRQVRRLFSRDAWLIAGASLLPGIGLGILTVWAAGRLVDNEMSFGFSPWLLLPVLALSALCIFLSSFAPLRRASRQMPMGVLRDTGMLRKAKKFRSRKQFRATGLIAGRQARLHPFRQAGAAVMIALMLIGAFFVVEIGLGMMNDVSGRSYDFKVSKRNWSDDSALVFSTDTETAELTEQDLAQIAAIPEMDYMKYSRGGVINLILRDEIPAYLRDTYAGEDEVFNTGEDDQVFFWVQPFVFNVSKLRGTLDYLLAEEEPEKPAENEANFDGIYQYYKEMQAVQEVSGETGKLLPVRLFTIDPEDEMIRQAVREGAISREKLDAGLEVLVYAPDQYVGRMTSKRPNEIAYICETDQKTGESVEWIAENHNDYFHPGQQLEFLQMIDHEPTGYASVDAEKNKETYARMEQRKASAAVGAVLAGDLSGVEAITSGQLTILTTEAGATALGLYTRSPRDIDVTLDGEVDNETEEAIQDRLERIAMRADMGVYNHIQGRRESRDGLRKLITLFAGIIVLFFAVSVAMQVGNTGRRIRADRRMLGTLRAVGADRNTLVGCYRLPMILASLAGLILGIAFYLVFRYSDMGSMAFPAYHPEIVLPLFVVLSGLCLLCCLAGVRARLGQVLKNSIVENIREL